MRSIDQDTITQAVIASHAQAGDARLREVMTSLVQHLHAFAREVRLTEDEWAAGLRFLAETGRACQDGRPEFALLSDTLGLSMLVTALNQRKPRGCTDASAVGAAPLAVTGRRTDDGEATDTPLFVRGRVRTLDGTPVAGADVEVRLADTTGQHASRLALASDGDGRFHFRCPLPQPRPVPHDGPVGRLLEALGRHPWRPAHLQFTITAPGGERLVTHVFRAGDRYLDSDAVFGVRASLVADWVRHERGAAPDGSRVDGPFHTLDFDFVLHKAAVTA